LIWKFNTGRQITSSPRVLDGVVYFGGVDGNVYALDAENGQPLWYYPTQGPITSSPFIEENKVYIGSIDFNIYALKAEL
jgi:outer membrane protein assembly factor BamB